MPTYEYACTECSSRVEVVQSFRDDPLTTCGVCGGRLRKVFSPAGIIFKGSGYYVNDSRAQKAGGDRADTADKKAATSGEGADSGKPTASGDGGTSSSGNGTKSGGGGKSSDGAGSASSKGAAAKPT